MSMTVWQVKWSFCRDDRKLLRTWRRKIGLHDLGCYLTILRVTVFGGNGQRLMHITRIVRTDCVLDALLAVGNQLLL